MSCVAISVYGYISSHSPFQDLDNCPSIDGRSYLSQYCQEQALLVNNTLGFSIDINSFSYTVNSNIDGSLISNWCGYCASNISSWIEVFDNSSNTDCHFNSVIIRSICSKDPVSNIECAQHLGNFAVPTLKQSLGLALLLGENYAKVPKQACSNVSCCEAGAISSLLNMSFTLASGRITRILQAFRASAVSNCADYISDTCETLLFQKSVPTATMYTPFPQDTEPNAKRNTSAKIAGVVLFLVGIAGLILFSLKRKHLPTRKNFEFDTMKNDDEFSTKAVVKSSEGVIGEPSVSAIETTTKNIVK